MRDLFVTVVIAVLLFEVLEHLVLPLAGLVVKRMRKSSSNKAPFVGQIVEVREWEGTQGLVSLRGELWKAASDGPLTPGDKAIVREIEGLTLSVGRLPRKPSA